MGRVRSCVVGWGVVVVALAGSATPARAAGGTDATVRTLRAAMRADLRSDPKLPGEALAVDAPGVHVALAVGDADADADTPLLPGTPFRVASVTKTFVAAAVLRLVEQHRVALDDPIATYLAPETVALLTSGGYDPQRITLRELLDHTSGLYDYASSDAYDDVNTYDPTHQWTAREQLQFAMDHGAPVGPPGEKYHYSDTGYVLLGEILQRVTGDTLPGAVRGLLHFDRLGLADTWWEKLESARPVRRRARTSTTTTSTTSRSTPPTTCTAVAGWCRPSPTSRGSSARCSRATCSTIPRRSRR